MDLFVPENDEVALPIEGYGSKYSITSLGRVVSRRSDGLFVKRPSVVKGYAQVQLCDGKDRRLLVHRLVAIAFIPNPQSLPVVDHIDRDTTNNAVDNLRWLSRHDNQARGHRGSKLCVLPERIKSQYLGGATARQIADEYGVTERSVYQRLRSLGAKKRCCTATG